MDIRILPAFHYPTEIKELFSEYTQMLMDGDPEIQKYLSIQNYEKELEHPEAKYGPPAGRLYLAFCEGSPAGCIGLRPLKSPGCEMKRLYVRPAFRKNHIGHRLIRTIIKDAREIGYSHMLLDTLPFLSDALALYKKYGFYEIPCYNDSPLDTSIYMRLDL